MPDSNCSSCRNSKCRRTSSSRSASNWRRCISMLRRLASSRSQSITELLSDRFNHTRDRANDAFELRHLDGQLSAACCSQLVVTSPAVASRRAPLRGHPSLNEHPLDREVKRDFFDMENVIRYPLNRIGDLISMHLAGARQSFQDQQISDDVLQVEEGSLYPALQRMLIKGWVTAKWSTTAGNRRARYYQLTTAGRKQLAVEMSPFERVIGAITRVIEAV